MIQNARSIIRICLYLTHKYQMNRYLGLWGGVEGCRPKKLHSRQKKRMAGAVKGVPAHVPCKVVKPGPQVSSPSCNTATPVFSIQAVNPALDDGCLGHARSRMDNHHSYP